MAFDPKPGQELIIEGIEYHIAEHPSAPGIPFGQEGRAAIVYKLESSRNPQALKVFKSRFRTPDLASLATKLAPYASIPGLTVCRRSVLTPQKHNTLLRQIPELTYSVLMPWIEGPTWLQVLQEKKPFSLAQSHSLSQAFAHILAEMEQQGVAHCDLSAANLIVPALAPDKKPTSYALIELVDVEQLFAKNLDQPEIVPSGSDGYSHKTIRQDKIWNVKVDRFAGALLLSEMLGWSDPSIQDAAWGESYFDPQELQRTSQRYDLLHDSISRHWGENVAGLLERAWESEILADCPTFGEWLVALPDSVSEIHREREKAVPVSSNQTEDPTITTLLEIAEKLIAQGNRSGALETYRKALTLAPMDSAIAQVIRALIRTQEINQPLETKDTATIERSKTAYLTDRLICPHCEKFIPDRTTTCPHCGKAIGQSTNIEVESNHSSQKFYQNGKLLGISIALVALLGVVLTILQLTKTQGGGNPFYLTTVVADAQITLPSSAAVTPSVTSTVQPTPTERPMNTPWPTVAPSPTTALPSVLSNYLTGVKIIRINTFDTKGSDMAFSDKNASVQNGQLYLVGRDYSGGAEKNAPYFEGHGVLLDFKLSKEQSTSNYEFETYFENGTWWTDNYRRFGVYIKPSIEANLWQGKTGTGNNLLGTLNLKIDVWYQLAMVIGKGGDFFCIIWDPNDASKLRYFRQPMAEWANTSWHFTFNGARGNVEIDNLMDISFDGYVR